MSTKTVVVAGGTSGINLGIAKAFIEQGHRACIFSRSSERVDAALADIESELAIGLAADVRDYDAVESVFREVAECWGPIDILISGAAGNFLCDAAELSAKGFKTVVDIDLNGCFNVMRAAFPHLRKPGATVINISAPQSIAPTPQQIHVCAAKAGIDQITRTAAMEWGPLGVRVNAISPGPIAGTEGMRRLAPTPTSEAIWTDSVPLKRWGTVDEIASAAIWLCSESASYVTGVVLPVDGGWSLGGSSSMTQALT